MRDHGRFPETIETDRLRMKRLDRAVSVRDLYRHAKVGAPHIDEITEHVPWEPHASMDETREYLDAMREGWENGEHAAYAIVPRADEPQGNQYAGNGDLSVDWDRRSGSLGTWLRKPFWGRGYSAERAAALLRLAFDRLDLDCVAVTHEVGNDKSRRAIEKYVARFGGTRDGTFRNFRTDHDGATVDSVRYTISREAWTATRPEDPDVSFD